MGPSPYRRPSPPPIAPRPPRELDEIGWALLAIVLFASIRAALGIASNEGASAQVLEAAAIALAAALAAARRVLVG